VFDANQKLVGWFINDTKIVLGQFLITWVSDEVPAEHSSWMESVSESVLKDACP
jgi:hypothetical protein